MPGPVPGIHDFTSWRAVKTWMAGTSPAMTNNAPLLLSSIPNKPRSRRRGLRQFRAGADRARHSGAAKAAIPERILRQILLVIILGEIELGRVDDLGGDGTVPFLLQLLLVHRL